jgi:hypothetical protein
MDELQIKALVTRLSRPHASGGVVIERAAILAAGADFPAVMDWIADHEGTPEETVNVTRSQGLHGSRMSGAAPAAPPRPTSFVLPAGALDQPGRGAADQPERGTVDRPERRAANQPGRI